MKKFILIIALALVSASVLTPSTSACSQDDNKSRGAVVADSIRSKTNKVGEKVAEGAQWVADSAAVKGKRLGKKVAVQADTLAQRGKRAWRVMTGKDQKDEKSDD